MQTKTQYQMRVRKDLTAKYQDSPLGIGRATEITSYIVNLPSIEAVMEQTKELEALKGYEVISIILIHEDNQEQLGEDFDWENGTSKSEIFLRWIDVNERMPEQGQKVLIYRPFAHEKPHIDPNIKTATYCGNEIWMGSHFEHVITHWMPLIGPPEELPFI